MICKILRVERKKEIACGHGKQMKLSKTRYLNFLSSFHTMFLNSTAVKIKGNEEEEPL